VTISAVTQFASALRAQMNLGIDTDKTGSASTNNGTQLLSKAVSSLDLSNAQYGTLLLKDTLHEQAQAFAVVTFQEQQLSSLNTHLVNIQNVVDELAVTDPADTIAHAALVEELVDREDQLSTFIGAQFHASELNIGAVVNANLGVSSQTEILNLYENDREGADIIGQMAAIEVNFTKIFDALHNEIALNSAFDAWMLWLISHSGRSKRVALRLVNSALPTRTLSPELRPLLMRPEMAW
jgi:hypothetical protein